MGQLLIRFFKEGSNNVWLNNIFRVLNEVLLPVLIIVLALGTIFVIYFSFMMAKAETKEKKDVSKKKIINILIAMLIFTVLIVLTVLFINFAPEIFGEDPELVTPNWWETPQGKGTQPPEEEANAVVGLLNYTKVFLR